MKLNEKEVRGLFSRVIEKNGVGVGAEDKLAIETLVKKVFGNGGRTPNPALLHDFSQVVVEMADEIAKPKLTNIFELFADIKHRDPGKLLELKIPQKNKAKVVWAALGSGVDLVRVEGKKSIIAAPVALQGGFYYEPLDLVSDSVYFFNKLINDVADMKTKLYLDKIYELTAAAVTSRKIPVANVFTGADVSLAQYGKVASTLSRYGGKPVFVADTLLIDHFANQQGTDAAYKNLLSDRVKDELLTSLSPTIIGKTLAVNLVNPFTDETNTKVELPVNKGYMFAGDVSQKPFSVVEYGGLRQQTDFDIQDERIKVKVVQEASVTLVFGEAIGLIEDSSVTL